MTRRGLRLVFVAASLLTLGTALGLVLYAMRDTIVFFHAPSAVVEKGLAPGTRFRLGGLVKEGSVQREGGQAVRFEVTDTARSVAVRYVGLLPDLFREGQGVVAEGVLEPGGVFRADTVLARHDETYMPREVADALKASGQWQGDKRPGGTADARPPQTP